MATTLLTRAGARIFPSEPFAHSAAVALVLLAAAVIWLGFTGLVLQRFL